MNLIEKKLRTLDSGDSVKITFAEGSASQVIEGIVDENDFEESFAMTTEDGEMLIIRYSSVKSVVSKKTETAPPSKVVKTVDKEKKELVLSFMPSLRISVSDELLKSAFGKVGNKAQNRLRPSFDNFMSAKKTNVFSAIQTAKNIYDMIAEEDLLNYDLAANNLAGYIYAAVDIMKSEAFLYGGDYCTAAVAEYLDESDYTVAGALAMIALLKAEKPDIRAMWGILTMSSIKSNDITGVLALEKTNAWKLLDRSVKDEITAALFEHCGAKKPASSSQNPLFSPLAGLYSEAEMAMVAEELYEKATGDALWNNTLARKAEEIRLKGEIFRLSWASDSGMIRTADKTEYSFVYAELEKNLLNKVKTIFTKDVERPIAVSFVADGQKAVKITYAAGHYVPTGNNGNSTRSVTVTSNGDSPLQAGRKINAGTSPYRFRNSVPCFKEALNTPDCAEAVRELVNNYAVLAKEEGKQDYLEEAVALYKKYKDKLPKTHKYHNGIFDIFIKLKLTDEAVSCFKLLCSLADCSAATCLHRCSTLAQYLYDRGSEQRDAQLYTKALEYFTEWIRIYEKSRSRENMQAYSKAYYQDVPLRRAMCMEALERYDEARSVAQQALKFGHSDECKALLDRIKAREAFEKDGSAEAPETLQPQEQSENEALQTAADGEEFEYDDYKYTDVVDMDTLGLSEGQIVENALQMAEKKNFPALVSYLKVCSPCSENVSGLNRLISYAVDSPLDSRSYDASEIIQWLGNETDERCRQLADCAKTAICLRSAYYDTEDRSGATYSICSMTPPIDRVPSAGKAMDILCRFKSDTGHGMGYYAASGRPGDGEAESDPVAELTDVYNRYFVNEIHDDSKKTIKLTRVRILEKNGLLESLARCGVEDDYESAQEFLDEFRKYFIKRSMSISAESIDAQLIEDYIDLMWDQAKSEYYGQKNEKLMGSPRNNIRSFTRAIVEAISAWVASRERSRDRQNEEDILRRLGADKAVLISLLEQTSGECSAAAEEENAGGYEILKFTADELRSRLDGTWNGLARKYFFADMLRSGRIMLNEEFLPELSATFFSLPDFNILSNIEKYVEEESGQTLQEHFASIYENTPASNDYGTAQRIVRYQTEMKLPDVCEYPENAEEYVRQTALRAEDEYISFIEEIALAISRGQISISDRFMNTLNDTISYWYNECCRTENYGFFFRLVESCRRKIFEEAKGYAEVLKRQLDVLKETDTQYFSENGQVCDEILEQIEAQNFTVAEDWMNRIQRREFSAEKNESESSAENKAAANFRRFCDEYEANYCCTRDGHKALSALLSHSYQKNRNIRGGQALVNNWLSNGRQATTDKIKKLLTLLDWDTNINVERVSNAIELYSVTYENKAGLTRSIRHPIAAFGSQMPEKGIYAACLYGGHTVEQLMGKLCDLDCINGNKIIFIDSALKLCERRALTKLIKQGSFRNTQIVVDRVMILYLAEHYFVGETGRMMLQLAMPFTYYQPYVVESTLTIPPEMFIGRERELQSIEDVEGAALVYGGRQLGKTALLKKAKMDINSKGNGSRAVLVDVKDKGISGTARLVSNELVDLSILDEGSETDNWEELSRRIIRRLRANNGEPEIPYLLLMLDEADCFIEGCKEVGFNPIEELKRIQTSCPGQFKFVLAGLHNIMRFNREDSQKNNCVMAHYSSSFINIRPFSYDEAKQLLTYPLSYLGFSFEGSELLMDHILATTNYFPGLIQLYCRKLIESLRETHYAGYSETEAPQYVVTETHLRKILSDQTFIDEIRDKFEITLELDTCYYSFALLLALMYEDRPSDVGYTAKDFHDAAEENCVVNIAEMSIESIDAWLYELYELNILRSQENGHYLFTTKSFRDLMGTKNDILRKLESLL